MRRVTGLGGRRWVGEAVAYHNFTHLDIIHCCVTDFFPLHTDFKYLGHLTGGLQSDIYQGAHHWEGLRNGRHDTSARRYWHHEISYLFPRCL